MSKYEMRGLKVSDVYPMSKIFKKMDINFKFEDGANVEQVGAQLIQKLLENIHLAEEEINKLLASLIGMEEKEFAELPLGDLLEVFELFKRQKDIVAFLKLAGK